MGDPNENPEEPESGLMISLFCQKVQTRDIINLKFERWKTPR